MMASGGLRRRAVALVALLSLGLAACDQSTVPSPTTGSATASASGSATPGASVKPIPSRDPGQVAVTKFFALATDKAFAYQATFTGASHHTTDILPISKGVLQVSGANVRVRATFTLKRIGAVTTVEHRAVGGRAWIKYGSLAWQRWPGFTAADSMAAFAAVHAPPDVTYLGPVKSGGKTAYQVSIASAIVNPIMIPAGNLTERSITDSKLVLLIDAEGRPLSGTATITGRGRVSGQLQEILIDLKLTFLKVGQKVTISAP
jgi:hypothetical protein